MIPINLKRIFILLLILSPYYGWSQISASDSSGCAPLVNVTFSGPAGATGINWDFDDGTISNLASPVHTFTLPGIYNVEYTATIAGIPVTYNLMIDVFGKPSIQFTATPPLSGCTGLNVTFSDASTGGGGSVITLREWSFGDGGVNVGNDPTPSYIYSIPGSFTVTLKATDGNGCDSSLAKPAYVNISNPPIAVITTNPNPPGACLPPLLVAASGANSVTNSPLGGGLTYFWDFGNGVTSTAMNPPPFNYTAGGTFPISLTVTDNINCSGSTVSDVVISAPVASFTVLNAINDTICGIANFQNTSTGTNPYFSYGDGTFGIDTIHAYPQPGTYQVNLQVQSGNCFDDTTITVVVEEVVADFTISPSYSCSWPTTIQFTSTSVNAATYYWIFGDSTFSTAQNPVHTFFELDTNQYTIYYQGFPDTTKLFIISEHGCTDSIAYIDTVFKPTARFMPNVSSGCAPLTVAFSDSSVSNEPIINYKWNLGDGTVNNGTSTNVVHTYTLPGIYYVTLIITNIAGCIDTSYIIPIYVGEPPSPAFSVTPVTVCANTPVQFQDLTPAADSAQYWHYSTDAGMMSHCYNDPDPVWNFNTLTGLQSITLTSVYNGCSGTTILPNAIDVDGPIAHFDVQGDCSSPMTYNFQGDFQEADYWTWDFGDGTVINNSTAITISHTYTSTGNYLVMLTSYSNTTGCSPYKDTSTVYVRNILAAFQGIARACTGDSVYFSAAGSVDVFGNCHEGYLWYWGDDTPPHHGAYDSMFHVYNDGGTYSIKLVVKDINGCIDTVRNAIQIYEVEAYFVPDKLVGCMPLTINFTDSSFADTTIVSWFWDFGNGITSTLQNPSNTYTQTGISSWTVKLVVTTALGCKDSMVIVVIPSIPDPSFGLQTTNNICAGDSVKFYPYNTGHAFYNWNFGNGTLSTALNPTCAYPVAGVFNVTLTVFDSLGCMGTLVAPALVNVQDYPIAAFVSTADTVFNKCYPLLVSFTDTSIGNVFGIRSWDLGNGSATIGTPTVGTIYQTPGTYNITLIETTTFGCSDTITKSITVEGPVGNFDIIPGTICKGQSVTLTIKDTADVLSYYWDFGDGSTALGTSPVTHTFNINPVSGQTMISIVMWSPDSACTATVSNPLNIHPVVAAFNATGTDSIFCLNEILTFNNLSVNAGTSNWNFGDGTTFSGTTPPPHSYLTPGNYSVSLSIFNAATGCTDSIIHLFTILDIPTAVATGGDTCQGSPLQLNASGGISYLWTPAAGLSSDTISNPVATPPSSTNYLVTVYGANGCADTATAEVIIYEPPAAIIFDSTMVIGQEVQLNVYAGPGYTYQWSPATGLSCITCPNPIAQPLVNTIYYVTISDAAGCFNITSTYEFIIKPITTIDVPTAFTPNGDGDNDIIFVEGLGIKKLIEFKIYNRWGQLLFETDDIDKGWDGFYMGKLQNVETYVYFASVETWLNGEILTKKGSFNLLR